MPPLPSLSGEEIVRIFRSFGWTIARQRGSYIVLCKENHIATLSVPNHRTVAKGTLRSLLRAADITIQEFLEHLRS